MLPVHWDQSDIYEITINGFASQKNKQNKKRNFKFSAIGNPPQYYSRS